MAACLAGCDPVVRGTMGVANRISDSIDAARDRDIASESIKLYQAMADAGDPKGKYYMAIIYVLRHQNDPNAIFEIKRRYEEAVAAGSNDAKVALGQMLVRGDSYPFIRDEKLPLEYLDPQRGLALLKSAAEQFCSFTQPLVGIDRCRERESSIPYVIEAIYFNGTHRWVRDEAAATACRKDDSACLRKAGHWQITVPKDRALSDDWRERARKCEPQIEKTNRSRGCFQ